MDTKATLADLVRFENNSESGKFQIIKKNKHKQNQNYGWYQTPKSCIPKSLINSFDLNTINENLEKLKRKNCKSKMQLTNRNLSIKVLEMFKKSETPKNLLDSNIKIINNKNLKKLIWSKITIDVSPEIIIRKKVNDKYYIGLIKIHICKSDKHYDYSIQNSLLIEYLQNIKKDNEEIDLNLIYTYDAYQGKFIGAQDSKHTLYISKICNEYLYYWNKVA